MVELLLIGQLAGPWCGQYGMTPDEPFTGCVVPNSSDPYGTRLRTDPFAPGGVRASPAGPPPMPSYPNSN